MSESRKLVDLGISLEKKGELDLAIRNYDKALEINPNDAGALLRKAGVLLRKKELNPSWDAYQKALALDSNLKFAYIGLGYILTIRGQLAEAEAMFAKASCIGDGDSDEVHVALGWLYNDHGLIEKARIEFSNAIEINPKNDGAHEGLGFMYLDDGLLQESLKEFELAIQLNVVNAGAYVGKGNVLVKHREFDKALPFFEKALSISRFDDSAHNGVGMVLEGRGDLEGAQASFAKAIESTPQVPFGYMNMARILQERCDFVHAKRHIEKAIELVYEGELKSTLLNWLNGLNNKLQSFQTE